MYTYMYIYTHTYIHIHIYTYTHIHIQATTKNLLIYIYVYIYVQIHVYMHTCIHVYTHTCIHVYTHTHTWVRIRMTLPSTAHARMRRATSLAAKSTNVADGSSVYKVYNSPITSQSTPQSTGAISMMCA